MPHPVRIVLALVAFAALACSVSASTAHFKNARLVEDPAGDVKVKTYSLDAAFYCVVELREAGAGTGVRAVWQRAMVDGDTVTGWETVAETEMESGSATLTFDAAPGADGWLPGDYRLRLYLEGDHKQTIPFTVK